MIGEGHNIQAKLIVGNRGEHLVCARTSPEVHHSASTLVAKLQTKSILIGSWLSGIQIFCSRDHTAID